MKLKDILTKIAKGESLTDAEKTFLSDFDADKQSNDAVAAYRRKADEKLEKIEKERDELKTQIADIQKKLDEKADAGKSEVQKLAEQNKKLAEQIGSLTKRLEDSDKEKATLARSSQINKLREKAGIKFIPGVSEEIMSAAFAKSFDGIESLEDESVTSVIDAFKAANKAVIADNTGHGSGTPPNLGGSGGAYKGKNPFKAESLNLTEQGKLFKENPAEAKRLAAEAGIELTEV